MTVRCEPSAPIRAGAELRTLNCIDDGVRRIANSLGAVEVQYPVLIARDVLDRAEYPQAFPHLLLMARHVNPLDGGHIASGTCAGASGDTWCLSPAVCYHTYAHLAGQTLDTPIVLTARGRCFRAECETSPGVRQIEFEMRELVLLGPAAWVDVSADSARCAVEAMARDAGLVGEWHGAEDPFFLPAAAGNALLQRLLKLKAEFRWPGADGLALASVNRHGTFFGQRFGITTPDGHPAHTACIALGLDRWAHHARRPQESHNGGIR